MGNSTLSRIGVGILVLFLITSIQAAPSTSWGVKQGDVATYWLDSVYFSETGESNLAVFLGDNNRTQYLVITDIGVSTLNYTLGLLNGTEILPDQQVRIDELEIEGQGQSFLVPGGDLPLVLPVSAGDQGNYFQYLASIAGTANFIIAGLLEGENITNILDPQIGGLYRSDLLGMNITDDIVFNSNQTINSVNLDVLVGYNATDGLLMEVDINAAIDTTQVVDLELVNETMTFNATLLRQSYQSIQDVILSNSELISSLAENNFLIMGLLPAFVLLRRRN
ncbi:MAG: hypothetical protein ACXAE3_12895 [Candidatus Kariarchaeaceae archaeon]|jgi:hypothetical protein